MKRVFVASPFAASAFHTSLENVEYARLCMLNSLLLGEAPYLPHLLYPQVLDDTQPAARMLAMLASLEYLRLAHVLAVYVDRGISRGMKQEIEFVAARRTVPIPVVFRRLNPSDDPLPTLKSVFSS